jgi:cholesterol oxidase
MEDAGLPYLFSWIAELSGLPGTVVRGLKFLKMRAKYRTGLNNDANLSAEIANLLGPATTTMSTLALIAMGRDFANGRLSLKGNLLACDWSQDKSQAYFDRVRDTGDAIARALNGKYVDTPSYKYLHQVLTAHPLGGCPMGFTTNDGVVNSFGEVFGYPGLYVVDGSVMPGAVGPNPSLTIAAISDRAADHIIGKTE